MASRSTITHVPAGPVPSHPCPVTGCGATVRQDRLMCWEHWQRVPPAIRNNVWREWHHGHPTEAYARVRQDAIDAVERLEARS